MAMYPYQSELRRELEGKRPGQDYVLWRADGFDAAQAIAAVKGGLLELGGPSTGGFYFLDGVELPRELTISNVHDVPYARDAARDKAAEELITTRVNAAALPYQDGELGLVLARHLSHATDDTPHTKKAHDSPKWQQADSQMAEVYLGLRQPEQANAALRVQMFREAYRALEPGGLLITDGALAELEIMKQAGFTPKILLVKELEIEEVVLRKARA